MAVEEGTTLIVRHLPSELKPAEQEDLLRHFGASIIRTMGNKGRMKHIAFATFPNRDLAKAALDKLHQLEILGTRLVVEFSTSHHGKFHPSQSENLPKVKNSGDPMKKEKPVVRKEEIDMKKVSDNVNAFGRPWGVQYPMDPRLEYMYPAPSVTILTNIANALASIPKLYVQVLHLMNKMNLPAPFGPITPTPVLPEGDATRAAQVKVPVTGDLRNNIQTSNTTNVGQDESTDESEIESEGESEKTGPKPSNPLKRPKKSRSQPRKKQKLIQVIPPSNKPKTAVAKPSEVFEQPDMSGPKKIAFHLPRLEQGGGNPKAPEKPSNEDVQEAPAPTMTPLPGAPPLPPPSEDLSNPPPPPPSDLFGEDAGVGPPAALPEGDLAENGTTVEEAIKPPDQSQSELVVVEGGFGKIEPVVKESSEDESSDENEEWGKSDFISSRELRKGRLSSSEMRDTSVFKKYEEGEPSTRLYIKNIAKQVTEKDLHFVYGRYVDWGKQDHCNMFDIRLMKEGRMKGQAFVTLPNIKRAKEALKDTNGYVLQSKPVVVQFARSAKAKTDAEKGPNAK